MYVPPRGVRRDLIPEPSLISSTSWVYWDSLATTAAAIDVRPKDFVENILASEQPEQSKRHAGRTPTCS
jgi:hypothetical protein